MLRRTTRLFFSLYKLSSSNASKNAKIIPFQFSFFHFSSIKPTRLQLLINNQLSGTDKIQDVLNVFSRYKTQMNLINYTVLLKQLTKKIVAQEITSLPENTCTEIVQHILSQLEKEDLTDSRLVSSLYFYLSRFPVSNLFKMQCNLILEQKGMQLYKDMNSENITNFLYALAQNKNTRYFEAILPFVAQNIKSYNFRTLFTILYDCCVLEIQAQEFGNKIQDFLISQPDDFKINAQDYSFIFFYCGKNPHIMNNPKLFAKLEGFAKFQAPFCNDIALSNIFHGLTFYDKPMVSPEFYKLFESRILNLLADLSHQALSLILRGYCTFGFGSDRFYEKFMEEACKRVNDLDREAFTTILFFLAQTNKVSVTMLAVFTKRLISGDLEYILPRQFEHIFYAFFNLLKDDLYEPDAILLDHFHRYIVDNIRKLTFQEIGNIANMVHLLLPKKYHEEISSLIQRKILNEDNLSLDSVDLKSLCEVAYFVLHEASAPYSEDFVKKVIDLGVILAEKKLTETETGTEPTVHFLRYYGKLLILLTRQQNLDKEYIKKRKQLCSFIEKWLVKSYEIKKEVPQDFTVEDILMNFVISFYTILTKPSKQTKIILKDALSLLTSPHFRTENWTFLREKTDLLKEPPKH